MVPLHLLANMQPTCSFLDTQFSGHKTSSPFIDKATEALPASFVLFLVIVNFFMWAIACMFQTSLELPLFFVFPSWYVCQMLLSCWQQVWMSFKVRWSRSFEIFSVLVSRLDNPFFFTIPFPLFWSCYSWTYVAMKLVCSKFLAVRWTDYFVSCSSQCLILSCLEAGLQI